MSRPTWPRRRSRCGCACRQIPAARSSTCDRTRRTSSYCRSVTAAPARSPTS
jgi:hypothetical protein